MDACSKMIIKRQLFRFHVQVLLLQAIARNGSANQLRPLKFDCLFCIQKNFSLYARARKSKHGLRKKHRLDLSKNHIYITFVDTFFH